MDCRFVDWRGRGTFSVSRFRVADVVVKDRQEAGRRGAGPSPSVETYVAALKKPPSDAAVKAHHQERYRHRLACAECEDRSDSPPFADLEGRG